MDVRVAQKKREEAHPFFGFLFALPLLAVGATAIGGTGWIFLDDLRFVRGAQTG